MHLKRVVTALIALPLFYLYITKLPSVFFLILLIIVSVIAQTEFHLMYKTKKTLAIAGIISGILLFIITAFSLYPPRTDSSLILQPLAFAISFVLISSSRLFFIKDPSSSLKDIAPAITGFLYIPNLLLTQWYLRQQGYEWIILLYGCVWTSDSLAYYIGKGMGKKRLYKEVSPNKTVAGAVGSVVGGILSAILIGSLMFKGVETPILTLIGCAIGVVTIVGDLVESMFKRDAGVKDSGSFIPGHGGVLDKIDGVLFAGPIIYLITTAL